MLFQDLCKAVNNNIVLKESVTKADVESGEDIVNNILCSLFYAKHKAEEVKDKKDYRLSRIYMSSNIYDIIKDHFQLIEGYRLFDICVVRHEEMEPGEVKYFYTYIAFEMGTKNEQV